MSSTTAHVAVLGTRGQIVPARAGPRDAARPPVLRLMTFAALGLYGVSRWSTLVSGGSAERRLLGLLGLALVLAGGRPLLARHSRLLAAGATTLVLVAVFPVAGLPLHWVTHLRLAVSARTIGEGLSALPQALVPYTGVNQWVRLDIVLGGAVLLFDAALLLAFAPRAMSDMRRGGAALALVALIAVPSTLTHPRFPYLDGLALFLMLAAFALGERITTRQASAALGLCLITAVSAMLVAPALDRHRAWLDYWSLAGGLAPRGLDTFNWSQTYGPVDWPRRGRTVLEISARRPEYWKTEDLDVFDGRRWTQGLVPGQTSTPSPSRRALATWSQTIQVTVRDMKSTEVVGAGVSSLPRHLSQPLAAGLSVGTWTAGTALAPGDSYTVRVYAPQPNAVQLRAEAANYAGLPAGYRTILLPAGVVSGTDASAQIVFAPFHSRAQVQNLAGSPLGSGASMVGLSAYAQAYRLAQHLAREAPTPYAFVVSLKRFLSHGYAYNQKPRVRPYPLESFLFADRRGYCQQFAGAMALLLRMGGVPARVAVGFTQGRQDPATGRWLVSDLDAHAWVEAWFPRYGWVRFDPTPAADPALRGSSPLTGAAGSLGTGGGTDAIKTVSARSRTSHRGAVRAGAVHRQGGVAATEIMIPAGLVGVSALALLLLVTRPLGSFESRVAELERALKRSGRTVSRGVTLAGVEETLHRAPEASAYVRALRLARFGSGQELPTLRQRRALRRQLALGGGPLRRLRALWALPPRRRGSAAGRS